MSFATYADLKISVATWLHRTDLTAMIPDFIALAEARLSADLDTRAMESRSTLTATSGNAWLTLPADLLEVRRLTVATDPVRVLEYAAPDQITHDFNSGVTGIPNAYAVIGTQIQLAPTPDAAYDFELSYWQRIPALSNSNTSNWLLVASPACYLYGALCEAAPYMQDDERIAVWEGKYKQAVDDVNAIDWYSGSTMRVRAG